MTFNPVENRLLDLGQRYAEFQSDPQKRLLIWQAKENATRFYQCFFEVQKHETPLSAGGFFILFDASFANSIDYSRNLKASLLGQYEASADILAGQGIAADWIYRPENLPDSAFGFAQSLLSFGSKHRAHIDYLVVVLMPTQVEDDLAFASWIEQLLNLTLPERLRLIVIDPLSSPRLTTLAASGDSRIQVDEPPIDGLIAAQETFAQEKTNGPAGVFRNLLAGLMALAERGSFDEVMLKAADALEFVRKHQWTEQEFVVRMLVAGALLRENRLVEAINHYQHARKTAKKAGDAGSKAGQELEIQALMGEAAAHLAGQDLLGAAECYDDAAQTAESIPNLILGIESYRMGCFSRHRLNESENALQRGRNALLLGGRLDPAVRGLTTLPLAGIDVLRVIDSSRIDRMQSIKFERDTAIGKARQECERQVLALGQTPTPDAFRQLEAALSCSSQDADAKALNAFRLCVARASPEFKDLMNCLDELLGQGWMMNALIALPPSDT